MFFFSFLASKAILLCCYPDLWSGNQLLTQPNKQQLTEQICLQMRTVNQETKWHINVLHDNDFLQ